MCVQCRWKKLKRWQWKPPILHREPPHTHFTPDCAPFARAPPKIFSLRAPPSAFAYPPSSTFACPPLSTFCVCAAITFFFICERHHQLLRARRHHNFFWVRSKHFCEGTIVWLGGAPSAILWTTIINNLGCARPTTLSILCVRYHQPLVCTAILIFSCAHLRIFFSCGHRHQHYAGAPPSTFARAPKLEARLSGHHLANIIHHQDHHFRRHPSSYHHTKKKVK